MIFHPTAFKKTQNISSYWWRGGLIWHPKQKDSMYPFDEAQEEVTTNLFYLWKAHHKSVPLQPKQPIKERKCQTVLTSFLREGATSSPYVEHIILKTLVLMSEDGGVLAAKLRVKASQEMWALLPTYATLNSMNKIDSLCNR